MCTKLVLYLNAYDYGNNNYKRIQAKAKDVP